MRTGGEAAAVRCHGRVAERSSLMACSLMGQRCRLDGRGRGKVSGGRAGRRALMAGQGARRAAAQRAGVRARSSACARREAGRARERDRGEKKGVEREKKGQWFDSVQTQNFQLKLKKF